MRARARAAGKGAVVVTGEDDRDKNERPMLGLRTKKATGVRTWLLIDIHGSAQVLEAGKHAIMRRACLPARDLRILDPVLSYPSTILGREHAIVVNLEHIKAIITAQEVLLLNSKDPAVAPFVLDLQHRLPLHFNALGQQVVELLDAGREEQQCVVAAELPSPRLPQLCTSFKIDGSSPGQTRGGPNVLPFEFRALEACLEAACSCLDTETIKLEREAYPALDELTSKISTLNLERVRQIKSRLVAISGRVQKVRDEIEQLLDDDGDMAEMYLTDKLLRQQLDEPLSPNSSDTCFGSPTLASLPILESHVPPVDLEASLLSHQPDSPKHNEEREVATKLQVGESTGGQYMHDNGGTESPNNKGPGTSSSSIVSAVTGKHLDVEELEMLLEAYFVQIDGTLNKLSTLREYVDDTEDYINIMLDDKQNHLLQMGVMLTTATLVISAFIVVVGVFGMNINIPLFNNGGPPQFFGVVFGSAAGCVLFYILVIGWCKYKNLIE
ncbi:unnamed protein product [Sphagnum troendelagicum]|uniref:Magnesium transporter n=1 Tax=Sphagnum troendelagicum TaxID=128251 RepID=A0ABP0U3W9_9BRYO